MATKRPAGGTLWEIATTLGLSWMGPWETIPNVMGTITLPGGTSAKVDITTHDDVLTLGRIKQNGAGLADVTDPGANILWDPDDATHQKLLAAFQAGSVYQFRFTFPPSAGVVTTKYGVQGQVSIGNGQADINGYLTYPITVVANKINFDVA